MTTYYLEYLKLKKKLRSWLGPIIVFILIMVAYPLTVEFLEKDLEKGFYSLLWISILLSMMFSTEDIFLEDFNDGTLEQIIISSSSFPFMIAKKIFIYWIMIGLPISALSFLFSLGITKDLNLSLFVIFLAMISSYIFLNLFVFGSALSLNKGSVLGALITMPIALPVLIVLGKSIIALQFGINYLELLLLLLGCLSIIISTVPFIVSYVIKAHLE
jgi:heme exporter protein B|tara:strand:+ start:380 stop:1027 length:648 start_codon:yes stop_codon:yes gene_type:complete